MSAKTKCVAKGGIYNSFLCFIEGKIQLLDQFPDQVQ